MPAARAVLWDLDGTLVDSEEYHWRAWRETMAAQGVSITREQFAASFGRRNASFLPEWLGARAAAGGVEQVADAKEACYRRLVRAGGIAALPGATAWVERLRREGWRQAIASSAPRLNVDTVLEALGLANCFQSVVAAEDVETGKPDPQVFLLAAARLEVPPERSIVVEDSAAGAEGARRAGMRSIGVSRTGKPLSADVAVAALTDLAPDTFERLLA
ncbi:MAG TPA: HAD family phosphatase [Bryobacteraceae bacterium]|nr:HAD family phosphatase [Bryobacteraceae bacterium]